MGTIGPRKPLRFYVGEWRKRRGLTQQQLADRLGRAKSTISQLENGKMDMSGHYMSALADALDIDPEDLHHHPDRPSVDALLKSASPEQFQAALRVVKALTGTDG